VGEGGELDVEARRVGGRVGSGCQQSGLGEAEEEAMTCPSSSVVELTVVCVIVPRDDADMSGDTYSPVEAGEVVEDWVRKTLDGRMTAGHICTLTMAARVLESGAKIG
jgi:hypothetical protein